MAEQELKEKEKTCAIIFEVTRPAWVDSITTTHSRIVSMMILYLGSSKQWRTKDFFLAGEGVHTFSYSVSAGKKRENSSLKKTYHTQRILQLPRQRHQSAMALGIHASSAAAGERAEMCVAQYRTSSIKPEQDSCCT